MSLGKIGIISAGEMGAAIGKSLISSGYLVSTVLEGRGIETRKRAQVSNIQTFETIEELIENLDIFMSILPPANAVSLAQKVAQFAKTSNHSFTYLEANAVSPKKTKQIAKLFKGTQVKFIDGGIIGLPPNAKNKPKLYISGPACQFLIETNGIAYDIKELGPSIGKASGMKMVYASVTKGLNALLTASFIAANRLELIDELAKELNESQKQLFNRFLKNTPRLPSDAARWAPEMIEIAETFNKVDVEDNFHTAASRIMDLLAKSPFGKETRSNRDMNRTAIETIKGLEKPSHKI